MQIPHARIWLTLTAVLLATTATAPSAIARSKSIPAASAFSLPSAQRCAGSTLKLKLRKLRHVKWLGATIKIDGRRVKTLKRSQVTKPVTLRHLPRVRFVLSISAKANRHRSAKATRTYTRCAPKPAPTPPAPHPPAPPSPPAPLAPGSYSGGTSQGRGVTFYVAVDGKRLQDVSISIVGLSCTPGKTFSDQLAVGEIAIGPTGAFSSTTKEDGVLFTAPAHFTYTFSGHFTGTTATGTFREDVAYDDGTAFSCSSNLQTWNVTRDAQGVQTGTTQAPGSYSGGTSQGRSASFYVSADRAHLQEVSVGIVGLGCTPGKSFDDQLAVADIPIAADGTFSKTATEDGVLFGVPAHFTYTFSGHLHGLSAAGVPRAGGTFRERITYDDGTAFDCTSNTQTWNTTRDAQGVQTSAPAAPGTYSGGTSQGRGVSFFVSPDHAHVQDVSVGIVGLGCTPSKSFSDQLAIPDIAIGADGAISATVTEDGVLFGAPAHFTYTFSGHLHGPSAAGVPRASGTFRERVTYDDGIAFDCQSNTQTWSTTRDVQGVVTSAAPPVGHYSGGTSQGRGVTFDVATSGTHLHDVNIAIVGLGCAPSKSFSDQLAISDIAVGSDGSFTATTTHDAPLFGVTGHFTYTFSGHFHGPSSSGAARAAGTFRERITYDDGTAFDCTSNTQTWTTTRTGA